MDIKQADLSLMFDVYCDVQTSSRSQFTKSIEEIAIDELIKNNKQLAYIYLHSEISVKKKVFWMNKLFIDCGLTDYDQLLSLLQEDSELIRNNVRLIILDKEKKVRKLLQAIIPKMEEELQGWTERILMYWNYLNTPKTKIKISNKQEAIDYSSKHIKFYCSQQITWVPQRLYTLLHWKGETDKTNYIPRYVIRYVLGEYMTLPKPVRIHACDAIVAQIDSKDWQNFIETLYTNWLRSGADVSEKEVIAPYFMYVEESELPHIRIQIRIWVKEANRELVSYSLQLLAARGTIGSLSMLNEFMEIQNSILLRSIARENFEEVARLKRLSVEEMADKIIPSLGFNRLGEQKVDYGPRAFKVTLLPDLSISVYDPVRKTTSSRLLPLAKNDNNELAEEKRKELTGIKTISNIQDHLQKYRLEKAFKRGRTWKNKAWKATFVDNPFMRYLAPGLIWEVYEDEKLKDFFLCMENGTLVTVSEEEYLLPDNAVISLAHPIDMTDEMLTAWKERLDHYKIVPFISQLDVPFFRFNDLRIEDKAINLYSGKPAMLSNIYKNLTADLSVLIIQQVVFIIDRSADLLIQIPYVIENNNSMLKQMYFSSIKKGDDFTSLELPNKKWLPLSALNDRYISDILYILSKSFPLR